MKKVFTILAGALLAVAAQAQGPSQKEPGKAQAVTHDAGKEKATKEAEAAKKATDLDPNTRSQLEQNRFQLYNLGAKPGC